MTTLNTRQTILLVVLFVATSLAFIQLDDRRALDPVKRAAETVLAPVVATLGQVGRRADDSELARENAALKAERDGLLAQVAQIRADTREVEQLRLQAKLQQDRPTWKMLQARIMGSDPTGQQMFVTIDKGARDGVEIGMAVVARGPNYIGQIVEVADRSAKVLLLIDASQTVGARLDSGPDGVVYGLSRRGGWLELRHLDRDAEVAKGELVLTTENAALRTARVPGNLIVGIVDEQGPTTDPQGQTQTAHVIPLVDFETLQVVTVVITGDA